MKIDSMGVNNRPPLILKIIHKYKSMYPTQGNDTRTNEEKPITTWQVYNSQWDILTVHLTDDPYSPIYFMGKPGDYKHEAVQSGL